MLTLSARDSGGEHLRLLPHRVHSEYLGRHAAFSPAWRFLIPVGFIGGFSTYSTFEWEVWTSLSSGAIWMGLLYVAVSLLVGLAAVGAGVTVARALP